MFLDRRDLRPDGLPLCLLDVRCCDQAEFALLIHLKRANTTRTMTEDPEKHTATFQKLALFASSTPPSVDLLSERVDATEWERF